MTGEARTTAKGPNWLGAAVATSVPRGVGEAFNPPPAQRRLDLPASEPRALTDSTLLTMCGIFGMISRQAPISTDALQAAVRSLQHRGPDAQTHWINPSRSVGLGHTRLSIMDLATGDQPMVNEDGSCHLVVNGEFYEFERLREALEANGHRFRTRSDSEIALHLYEEQGQQCLRQLRGEFAFILWDEAKNRLFAARDRFGIKPLFYAVHHGMLLIGSEAKALAAAGYPLRWDHEAMAQTLFAGVAPERYLFEGVRQVPPGHCLIATPTDLRIEPYWELDYPRVTDPAPVRTDAEWIEQLRNEADEAVRVRLRSDVPIGCLLSGGLDSSAALGLARQHVSGPIKTFTIAFDHVAFDESAVAGRSSAAYGAEFHPIRVTNADFAAHFSDAVWFGEGVHYNAHGAARYLLNRAVKAAGIKVVLAGEGADELCAGYRFCERALGLGTETPPATHWPEPVLRLLATAAPDPALLAEGLPGLTAQARALGYPELMIGHLAGKLALARQLIHPDFAQRFSREDPFLAFFRRYDVARSLDGREPIKQVLNLWMRTGFANYVLGAERLDMASAVEQRLPFIDHRLFEFARNLPGNLMMREGREKWALREAMRPFVTPEVYAGRKHPFLAPPSVLQDGSPMFTLVQDTLRSQSAASLPFFDHRALVSFLDQLQTFKGPERAPFDPMLLLLTSVAILHARYRL